MFFPVLLILLYNVLYSSASDHPETSLALGKWKKNISLTLKEKRSENITEVRELDLFRSSEKDNHEWKSNNLK